MLAFPFLLVAWIAVVIALYLGGPRTGKAVVGFVRTIAERTPGL